MNAPLRTWIDYALWLLLAVGFIGALKISYENITGNPCPHVFIVPVCYAVLIGYTLMGLSVIVNHNGCRHHFFAIGWSIAAAIAVTGSIAELVAGGGVCPTSGSGSLRGATTSNAIPLCYISLALLIGILILFAIGPYKRSCDFNKTVHRN